MPVEEKEKKLWLVRKDAYVQSVSNATHVTLVTSDTTNMCLPKRFYSFLM